MRELIENLIQAWGDYFRYYFHPKRRRGNRRIMRRRLLIVLFFVFIGLISVFWLSRSIPYGQGEIFVDEPGEIFVDKPDGYIIPTTWKQFSLRFRFFPLTAGSSLMAMLLHFARRKFNQFKRLFDIAFASLSLILISPLFLIIAILIKFDSSGPVFFRQKRIGKDGRIFKMWKFRTMRKNAEMETGPVWADEGDPRVTNLGYFLRSCHLDEIPQLINVFKGEMSVIGPRPERPEFVKIIDGHVVDFDQRLNVRPGITGLAQVRYRYGASIKDAARKLKYDLLYIKRMCWALDFQIIVWTIGRVLTGEGAR